MKVLRIYPYFLLFYFLELSEPGELLNTFDSFIYHINAHNLSRLNTFLECKIENERLKHRLADLKAQCQLRLSSASSNSSSIPGSNSTPSLFSSTSTTSTLTLGTPSVTPGTAFTHVFSRDGTSDTASPTVVSAVDFDFSANGTNSGNGAGGLMIEGEDIDGSRRKKVSVFFSSFGWFDY